MNEIPQDLRRDAESTVAWSEEIALELAKRARASMAIRRILDSISILFGIAALGVSISGLSEALLSQIVVVGAGVLLILSVLVDRMFGDPPERFYDYSFYVGSYESSIREILNDPADDSQVRRLREVIRLAQRNINDVRSKWPDVYSTAKAQQDRGGDALPRAPHD
ncbi:MAG: hypothetical protein Tsb0027_01420 [Wenzhouxiangellaceae bacterium]